MTFRQFLSTHSSLSPASVGRRLPSWAAILGSLTLLSVSTSNLPAQTSPITNWTVQNTVADCWDATTAGINNDGICTASASPALIGTACGSDEGCDGGSAGSGVCDIGTCYDGVSVKAFPGICTLGDPLLVGTLCMTDSDCDGTTGSGLCGTGDTFYTNACTQTNSVTGEACQDYDADLYENWDDNVLGTGDTDIVSCEVGYSPVANPGDAVEWYYWRWTLADNFNYEQTGSSRGYEIDIDTDFGTPGGDDLADVLIIYVPLNKCEADGGHISNNWIPEGGSKVIGYLDANNDVGCPNPDEADAYPAELQGSCDGLDADISLASDDIYVRIPPSGACDAGFPLGEPVVEVAIHASVLGDPTKIRSRCWSTQTSTLDKSKHFWHDENQPSDLTSNRQDNTAGADTGTWFESGSDAAPVSLAMFEARRWGDGVVFRWSTATESANVGFHLLADTADGTVRLNGRLIPSQRVNSATPLHYRFEALGIDAERFYLVDVDVRGREQRHGPFEIDAVHGRQPTADAIDWSRIRADHDRKARAREQETERAAQRATARARETMTSGAEASYPVYELRVTEEAIYRVTYEDLLGAGLDLDGVDADEIALTDRNGPVAIHVEADSVGRGRSKQRVFGAGSYIEFVGHGLESLYSNVNVYRLRVDASQAARVASAGGGGGSAASSYVATVASDANVAYYSGAPGNDPWYDLSMFTFQAEKAYPPRHQPGLPLEVRDLVVGEGERLELEIWGVTDWPQSPDHRIKVELNGVEVGDELFDGADLLQLSIDLPPGLLQEGTNELRLVQPGDTGVQWDLSYLNTYGVSFGRSFEAESGRLSFDSDASAFHVTGLTSPRTIVYRVDEGGVTHLSKVKTKAGGDGFAADFSGSGAAARYLVASEGALSTPTIAPAAFGDDITSGYAQYLIISHPDFLGGLGGLASAKAAQGLAPVIVSSDDIFAQFGGGVFDPQAIKDYVKYAVDNLGTEYVVLVGGDTYDYFDYLGVGSMSFIPTFYAPTHAFMTFTPVDPLYGDTDGDGVPNVPVGRLPVRDGAELDGVIANILNYESAPHERTAVFAADRSQSEPGYDDTSDDYISRLPVGWSADRAYLDLPGPPAARTVLIDAINSGRALTSFAGHSAPQVWTFEGLFNAADAESLTNFGQPTIVTQWGCWNAYHVDPAFNSLAHKFLLSGDRGASTVMGAVGLTEWAADRRLGELFFDRLFLPGQTLGKALVSAQQALAVEVPQSADAYLAYSILGDPAAVIQP